MEKRRGRPKSTDIPQVPIEILWKTFDTKPPHGEIVYVKNKKTVGNVFVKRMGNIYLNRDGSEVDAKQFTHWRGSF